MAARCPEGEAVGPAILEHYRFIIMSDGYASVEPKLGQDVYGVMWRLTPRDLAALNAYESLQAGLYRRVMVPVLSIAFGSTRLSIWDIRRRRGAPGPVIWKP